MPLTVELALDARATLGEGPTWDAEKQRLYWVDIDEMKLHAFNPLDGTDTACEVGCRVGAAVPRASGGMILATQFGFEAFDLETGKRTLLADPESHLRDNRFNDGKCDPRGRFWAGTMSLVREPKAAALYVLDTDGSVRRVLDGVTTSNGLGWSLDQSTMYYIDTPTLEVAAFDYDGDTGTIDRRRVVVKFPDGVGRPDGMTVDAEGMLWVAHWDGGRVTRWDPADGSLLLTVPLEADRVTSCTFGGPDLDRLYVTTAREGLDEEALARQPHAGGLFVVEPGVRGLPAVPYGG